MVNIKEKYMKIALKEANKAKEIDEVPIGCIIVLNGKIIAKAHNKKETTNNPCGHAEILAIQKACKKISNWRLENCDMYVTIEPCLMCAGAIIQSRIKNVYFGSNDYKGGAFGSSINALNACNINHRPYVEGGILKEECSEILSSFFENKRNN